MSQSRLLVVDDEPELCAFVESVGADLGLTVTAAYDGTALRASMDASAFEIVMLDLRLPGEDGVELLGYLADQRFRGQLVLMSGADMKILDTAGRVAAARGLNLSATIQKPIMLPDLEALLQELTKTAGQYSCEDIQAAMERNEFTLYYQPKIALRGDSAVDSVEALVRWNHPSRGLVLPGEFVPVLESCDLMEPFADFVLENAVSQARSWLDREMRISVAVNLSAPLAVNSRLPDEVVSVLEKHGVPARNLIIEITESGVMADTVGAMEVLTRLRLKDVSLSIDDFGTGFSSLVQLYRMPFSELKIDRSFVMEIERNEEARVIVRSIIDLARNLGMKSCAEGVETEATVALLRSWGCDMAQGYFFARPALPAEVTEFLQRWPRGESDSEDRCRSGITEGKEAAG